MPRLRITNRPQIFVIPSETERSEGPFVCLNLTFWVELAKHSRSLFQRNRLRAHVFTQPLALQRRAHQRRIVLALQIVQQRLALLAEAELQKVDKLFGVHSQLRNAWRHPQAQNPWMPLRGGRGRGRREREQVLNSRV